MRFTGLLALALSIPLWWATIFVSPLVRSWFVTDASWPLLRSCLAPDMFLAVLTAGAALGGRAPGGGRSWREGAAIGGWGYATAWTLSAVVRGDLRWAGGVMMLAAMMLVTVLTNAPPPVSSRESGVR